MTISSISSTSGSSGPTGTQAAAGFLGKDDFMKLLVAQLKHQDPSNPTDMNGMTEQMTQFGILEQLTNLAKANEAASTSLEKTYAVELLGKTVSYVGPDGATVEGVVEHVDTATDHPTLTVGGRSGIQPKDLVGVR